MDFYTHRYYKINEYFLSAIGVWPYQMKRKKILICSIMTFSVLSIQVAQVCVSKKINYFVRRIRQLFNRWQKVTDGRYFDCTWEVSLLFIKGRTKLEAIAQVVTCNRNVICILQVTPVFILYLEIYVKIYTYGLQTTKIKTLLELMFAEWEILKLKVEIEIMEKYARNGRRYVIFYATYIYCTAVNAIIATLIPQFLDLIKPLNQSRPVILLYPAEYFVDLNSNFAYIFTHMTITLMLALLVIIAADGMFFCYTEYVNGLFAIIGYRFQYLLYEHSTADISCQNLTLYGSNNKYRKILADTIQMHLRAINFVRLLESTYTVPFAITLGLNTIIMSCTLLEIVLVSDQTEEVIKYLLYVIAQIIHLFCLSFQGQKIIDSSIRTTDKIYNGLWYMMPAKRQKTLLIPLRRCLEPCRLSGGKIYIFSLRSFTTVIQTSMSYFTVLSSFH